MGKPATPICILHVKKKKTPQYSPQKIIFYLQQLKLNSSPFRFLGETSFKMIKSGFRWKETNLLKKSPVSFKKE